MLIWGMRWFNLLASRISKLAGSPAGFISALIVVIIWSTLGPVFDYSQKWQLFINTTTTIVTFLMVFLIQNSQNRDTRAMQLKLDELIRAVRGARELYMNAEELSDTELERLHQESRLLHQKYATELEKRHKK